MSTLALSLSPPPSLPFLYHFAPSTAAEDYVSLTASLTYESGSPLNSRRCANITIIDDDVIEPDQSFAVSLVTVDPVFLTPFDKAIVTIATDNDSKRAF